MSTNWLDELARQIILQSAPVQLPTPHPGFGTIEELFTPPSLAGPDGNFVEPDAALELSRGVVIVGPPGSGKTTLLRRLALVQATIFVNGHTPRCPAFVAAAELDPGQAGGRDLPSLVAPLLNRLYGISATESALKDSFVAGDLSLYIDGLDEIRTEHRPAIFMAIQRARETYPHLQLVLSSRPAAISGWPEGFLFYYLHGFTDASIASHVVKLSHGDSERGLLFLDVLQQNPRFAELARSPLLLTLLWQTFNISGRIPDNLTFLYADFTDYLLSRERQKAGAKRSKLSIKEVQHFLEVLALHQFDNQKQSVTLEEARHVVATAYSAHPRAFTESEILESVLTTGLLVREGLATLSFSHLSFLEYFTARALASDPHRLMNAIDRPEGSEIAVFASGIVEDVGPLVEAAVEKRQLLLAAKCISYGRLRNEQLAQYVVQEIHREIGDHFFSLMTEARKGSLPSSEAFTDLLGKWRLINQPGILAVEKGRRLERFAKDFFAQFFRVVRSNLNTEDGEIDLLLENQNMSPFWLEFGSDVLVECKNWSNHTPLHEVGAFTYKATRYKVRLAFFLSVAGFTSDARRTMRNQAASSAEPLIVPLIGEDIERMLTKQEVFEEFLKERIREIKYLEKY